jgi:hypothetical protein
MAALQPLSKLIDYNVSTLSEQESLLLETMLFVRLCEELKEIFRKEHKNYFTVLKYTLQMENDMLEANFLPIIIRDILSTNEYTLNGIAEYTNIHEDVICEIMSGQNSNPSVSLFRRIMELHKTVKRDMYSTTLKKITTEYMRDF